MAKVVYKYALDRDSSAVVLPSDARVVKVGKQGDYVYLWAEHGIPDENTTHSTRHFDVFGTGHPIPEAAVHVDTFFDAPFVWHVYEVAA